MEIKVIKNKDVLKLKKNLSNETIKILSNDKNDKVRMGVLEIKQALPPEIINNLCKDSNPKIRKKARTIRKEIMAFEKKINKIIKEMAKEIEEINQDSYEEITKPKQAVSDFSYIIENEVEWLDGIKKEVEEIRKLTVKTREETAKKIEETRKIIEQATNGSWRDQTINKKKSTFSLDKVKLSTTRTN